MVQVNCTSDLCPHETATYSCKVTDKISSIATVYIIIYIVRMFMTCYGFEKRKGTNSCREYYHHD